MRPNPEQGRDVRHLRVGLLANPSFRTSASAKDIARQSISRGDIAATRPANQASRGAFVLLPVVPTLCGEPPWAASRQYAQSRNRGLRSPSSGSAAASAGARRGCAQPVGEVLPGVGRQYRTTTRPEADVTGDHGYRRRTSHRIVALVVRGADRTRSARRRMGNAARSSPPRTRFASLQAVAGDQVRQPGTGGVAAALTIRTRPRSGMRLRRSSRTASTRSNCREVVPSAGRRDQQGVRVSENLDLGRQLLRAAESSRCGSARGDSGDAAVRTRSPQRRGDFLGARHDQLQPGQDESDDPPTDASVSGYGGRIRPRSRGCSAGAPASGDQRQGCCRSGSVGCH